MIEKTIKQQIETYYETQLTFQSDLEIFKYTALVEASNTASKELPKPQIRQLQRNPALEFGDDAENASNSISQLFGMLWEDKDVF